jgi:hypothetical protein
MKNIHLFAEEVLPTFVPCGRTTGGNSWWPTGMRQQEPAR